MGHTGQQRCTKKTYGKTRKTATKKVKTSQKKTSLRKSITPGTVLILLGGRFRGRRVVFVKQLESGLLLVTGPYAVNGVPLRRVNQRYCIATSANVNVKADAYKSVNDAYFAREKAKKGKKSEEGFFSKADDKAMPEERKSQQKKMDEALAKDLKADMKAYLKSRFSLTSQMYPHEMKF